MKSKQTFYHMLFLIAGLFLVTTLSSCSKEEAKITDNFSVSNSKSGFYLIQSLNKISDAEVKKTAYSTLDNQSKYNYWHSRLAIELSKAEYNSKQLIKIGELASSLTIEYFSNADKKAIFKAHFLSKWLNEAKDVFSNEQIYLLIFTLDNSALTSSANRDGGSEDDEANPTACICALNSSWTCPQVLSNPVVIRWGECQKLGKGCTEATTGCGAFADDACDGNVCFPA